MWRAGAGTTRTPGSAGGDGKPTAEALHSVPSPTQQIQALDRTAPVLPMMPGTPARATHDAADDRVRAGTSSLYAALDVGSGTGISSLYARHCAIEFKKFLAKFDAEVPDEFEVHVVLDNASTHKTPAIKRWLTAPQPGGELDGYERDGQVEHARRQPGDSEPRRGPVPATDRAA